VQLRLQRFVGWRGGFDEFRSSIGTTPVHPVQHQAVQVNGNLGPPTFDDYLKPLNAQVFRGAGFGHIRKMFTLPVGLEAQMDADTGTLRYVQPAVA